jgi:hypothetical protein
MKNILATLISGKNRICYQNATTTGARWTNFRPNISKEAPKNCLWPEKVGGSKMTKLSKKWQKRGRKIFFTDI